MLLIGKHSVVLMLTMVSCLPMITWFSMQNIMTLFFLMNFACQYTSVCNNSCVFIATLRVQVAGYQSFVPTVQAAYTPDVQVLEEGFVSQTLAWLNHLKGQPRKQHVKLAHRSHTHIVNSMSSWHTDHTHTSWTARKLAHRSHTHTMNIMSSWHTDHTHTSWTVRQAAVFTAHTHIPNKIMQHKLSECSKLATCWLIEVS